MAKSKQELARQKTAARAADPAAIWRLFNFQTITEAIDFANVDPAQKGGEFGVTNDLIGGGVAGFYFF
jgi:hypothetical protein